MIIVVGSLCEKGELDVVKADPVVIFHSARPVKPTIDGWLFFVWIFIYINISG